MTSQDPFIQRLVEIRANADHLLHTFSLYEQGWRFQFISTKGTVGRCDHTKKVIQFSQHFALHSTPRAIADTLLHEIAHALVGKGHGHDEVWQDQAIDIGADPYAKCQGGSVSTAKPNYRIKCPNSDCNWSVERFRMKRRNFGALCPKCGTEVVIYKITRK